MLHLAIDYTPPIRYPHNYFAFTRFDKGLKTTFLISQKWASILVLMKQGIISVIILIKNRLYSSKVFKKVSLWSFLTDFHKNVNVRTNMVVIPLRRYGHNLLSRNAVTGRPAGCTHQHCTSATPPKAFLKEPSHVLSWGRQNMCMRLWQDLSKICWRVEICSVIPQARRKTDWVSSSFAWNFLPYLFSTNLAYTLPGRLSK